MSRYAKDTLTRKENNMKKHFKWTAMAAALLALGLAGCDKAPEPAPAAAPAKAAEPAKAPEAPKAEAPRAEPAAAAGAYKKSSQEAMDAASKDWTKLTLADEALAMSAPEAGKEACKILEKGAKGNDAPAKQFACEYPGKNAVLMTLSFEFDDRLESDKGGKMAAEMLDALSKGIGEAAAKDGAKMEFAPMQDVSVVKVEGKSLTGSVGGKLFRGLAVVHGSYITLLMGMEGDGKSGGAAEVDAFIDSLAANRPGEAPDQGKTKSK